jgi:hypothetical protein
MAALTQQIQSQDSEYALLQDMMQLQSSFQVLVEPVEHVRKGFLSTLHGSCIIVAVSHAPSMRHTREDLDEVTNLWTRRKNSSTSEVPQKQGMHVFNENSQSSIQHDLEGVSDGSAYTRMTHLALEEYYFG